MKRATRISTVGFPTPAQLPKADKAHRGRTTAESTPLAIRSRVQLDDEMRDEIRRRFARKFIRHVRNIERASIRLMDDNGPKGGIDTICRIKIVIAGKPSVIAEERSTGPMEAFAIALNATADALRHALDRSGGQQRRVRKAVAKRARTPELEVASAG